MAVGADVGADALGPKRGDDDADRRRDELRRRHLRQPAQRPTSSSLGIHHLALACADLERTIRFYQETLGFPVVDLVDNPEVEGSVRAFLDVGLGNLLSFFDVPDQGRAGGEEVRTIGHVALSVSDSQFEELRARLEESGVSYGNAETEGERSICFRDPDGLQVELINEPLMELEGRRLGAGP